MTSMLSNPSNWRVRTKLIAILAVPVIAILVNAALGASSVLHSTRNVNRARDMTQISRAASALAYDLSKERTYTVGYAASNPRVPLSNVYAQRLRVDQDAQAFKDAVNGRATSFNRAGNDAIASATDRLSRLANIRAVALRTTSPESIQASYSQLTDGLLALIPTITQGLDDATLSADVQSANALINSTDILSLQQSLVNSSLQSKQFDNTDYRQFLGYVTEAENAASTFSASATPAQQRLLSSTVTGPDVARTGETIQEILAAQSMPIDLQPTSWLQSIQANIDLNNRVAQSVLNDVGTRGGQLRTHIQRNALLSGLLIVLILAVALIAAVVVARSLSRPLLALRGAALDIAGNRLPEAVRRLRDSTDQDIAASVEPVGIDTDEEIGEVARAFDEVHREAVRLASEQAMLRNNVNAMFVNLSRRSQGLVERQLRLIDDLENREQDPDQLSNLFKLDHLATRMRRNNESLLVLAGTDTARRWTHPVALNEVVLAAISEVEQYTRVKQTSAAPVSIAGHAVSDVVHLVAELLENSTSFSPPATDVLVTSHSLGPGAGAMIEIEDRGIGMPARDLERVNERLANPPVVDVSVSRTMGLFAVGRLASRHGIRVTLRESASGGITAMVRLPAKVVTGEESVTGMPAKPALGSTGAPARGPQPARRAAPSNGSGPGHGPGGRTTTPAGDARGGSPLFERANADSLAASAESEASQDLRLRPFDAPPRGGRGDEPDRPGPDRREPTLDHDEPTSVDGAATGAFPIRPTTPPGRGVPGRPGGAAPADPPRRQPGDDLSTRGRPDDARPTAFPSGPTSFGGPVPGGPAPGGPVPGGPLPGGPATSRPLPGGPGLPAEGGGTGPLQARRRPMSDRPVPPGPRPPADATPGPGRPDAPIPRPIRPLGPRPTPASPGAEPSPPSPAAQDARETDSRNDGGRDTGSPIESDTTVMRTRPGGEPAGRPRTADPLDDPSYAAPAAAGAEPGPEVEDGDTTPIFDSVSAWFQRRSPSSPGASRRPSGPQRRPAGPAGPAARPATPGRPGAGSLPVRRPGRGLDELTDAGVGGAPRGEPAGGNGPNGPNGSNGSNGAGTNGAGAGGPGLAPVAASGRGMSGPNPTVTSANGPGTGPTAPAMSGPNPIVTDAEPRRWSPGNEQATTGPRAASWVSAGDAGWQAAEAARQPVTGGTTRAGLPVRIPMTHLVPGSAENAPQRRPADVPTRTPEAVGGRLASFYQGVRQGRDLNQENATGPRRDNQEDL